MQCCIHNFHMNISMFLQQFNQTAAMCIFLVDSNRELFSKVIYPLLKRFLASVFLGKADLYPITLHILVDSNR